MPGSTSLGIPYPLQGEVIDATDAQDMATAIDTLLTQLDTLRDLANLHPNAAMSGGSVVTATGVNGTVTNYSAIDWDTASYCNLGTHPSSFEVPAGVYWAVAGGFITGATTVNQKRLGILHNSVIWGAQSTDIVTSGNGTMCVSSGTVVATGATNTIEVRTFWSGTGGPATTQFVSFRIYQIRTLANV